jgi:hypothetical protein
VLTPPVMEKIGLSSIYVRSKALFIFKGVVDGGDARWRPLPSAFGIESVAEVRHPATAPTFSIGASHPAMKSWSYLMPFNF